MRTIYDKIKNKDLSITRFVLQKVFRLKQYSYRCNYIGKGRVEHINYYHTSRGNAEYVETNVKIYFYISSV